MSFWDVLYGREQSVIGMSPMDGVTDGPFRYMVAKYGRPGVIFTEFVSVDGLHFAEGVKRERMLKEFIKARDLLSSSRIAVDPYSRNKIERENGFTDLPAQAGLRINETYPYEVAQVFGNKPDFFVEAARLIESLGFDGVDINMGCPAKNVSENGCGAALIKTPKLAQEIVLATKAATKLPVSLKTRIGVSSASEMDEWMAAICEVRPANISLHGRTLKQLYQGSADWETIGRAAEIVHKAGLRLLGNGDVESVESAKLKVERYGVDGVLIGRAAEGNPQIFQGIDEPDYKQRLAWAVEHAYVYEQVFKPETASDDDIRWFLPLRKHLAWYAHGFPGAVELRMSLMKTKNADEVRELVEKSLSN
ncbi:tRNA-dihydrouridine synthase [Candidatus Woesebacteria bacterium]|nr:tRNA-dihydrouridine synthase [Candidatus Woesebacteria bacterium]